MIRHNTPDLQGCSCTPAAIFMQLGATTIVTTVTYDSADNLRVVTLPNNHQITRMHDEVNLS